MKALFRTYPTAGLLVLRLGLAAIFIAHGLQKLGLFGGSTAGTLGYFQNALGIPSPLALVATYVEIAAGALLVVGLLSRLAGLALAVQMAVAAALVHIPNGFFMNWGRHAEIIAGPNGPTALAAGEGFEMNLVLFVMALAIAIAGAGPFSIDRAIGGYAKTRAAADGPAPAGEAGGSRGSIPDRELS